MRLFIIEKRDNFDRLANYWIFTDLTQCTRFQEFCINQSDNYIYLIACKDPDDRGGYQ